MAFPACDINNTCSKVKIFLVDSKFNILIDEHKEEDISTDLEKQKKKEEKKQQK